MKQRRTFLVAAVLVAIAGWSSMTVAGDEVLIEVESVRDVEAYYRKIEFYDIDNHPERLQNVPRTRIERVPTTMSDEWRENVRLRKSVFFRLGLSAVLQVNEQVLAERKRLLAISLNGMSAGDRAWLAATAERYKVAKAGETLTKRHLDELKLRVDALPPSLVMVQGAIESGWLQSRFARTGQALFGQWTTGDQGIKALESNTRLAAFETPRDSLVAYMLNLNTHPAYSSLRNARADMRRKGETLDGYALAEHIGAYAETGQEYITLIRSMIRRDDLGRADVAKLADGPRILFRRVDPE